MDRDELKELHYITHVENVPSICSRGLLSHRLATRVRHRDVSSPQVQDLRKGKRIPGGLLLHDYVNTYVTARNPMLFSIKDAQLDELCVIRVSPAVLDLEDVVITDGNAASSFCRFMPAAEGLAGIDAKLVRRKYWNDGDALERERCWNAKFTEVLVPNRVECEHLRGIFVGTDAARATLVRQDLPLSVRTNKRLFFIQ